MKLGKAAQTIFPQTHTLGDLAGPAFYVMGSLVALILWAFGLVWLFFASASIVRCKTFPFNIGWWGFTFPIGAYAMCTYQIGIELPSAFFRILGTVCLLAILLAGLAFWLYF
jgi:tellurite resistance protein TehA-like permease